MRRQKAAALAAGSLLAGLALGSPLTAFAAVFITETNCAGCTGIHFDPDPLAGDNLAFGSTQGGVEAGVTFTGVEPVKTNPAPGVAWVTGVDNSLTYLDVAVDPGFAFTLAGFNLNELNGAKNWFVKISAFNGDTLLASNVFNEKNNSKFKIAATGGDVLTHFQVQLVTDITGATNVALGGPLQLDGLGQIKIDGVTTVIPEPATWALMIMGFGGAGAMLRRRRQQAAT